LAIIHKWSKTAPEKCITCEGKIVAMPPSTEKVRIARYIIYRCQECGDVFPTRERDDTRLKTVRNKLFDVLGGAKCVCSDPSCYHENRICCISDQRCLQFDHVGGEGYAHRFGKNYQKYGSRKFCEFYVKNEGLARKELRVLCANCNWIKRAKEKECSPNMKKKARSSKP